MPGPAHRVTEPAGAIGPRPIPTPPAPPPYRPVALVKATDKRKRRRGGGALLVLAWLVTFAVLGAAAWAAYVRRDDVVRAWPASERAYKALGIKLRA